MSASIHSLIRHIRRDDVFKVGDLYVSFEGRSEKSFCLVVSDRAKPMLHQHRPYFVDAGSEITLSNSAAVHVMEGTQNEVVLRLTTDLPVGKSSLRSGGWFTR